MLLAAIGWAADIGTARIPGLGLASDWVGDFAAVGLSSSPTSRKDTDLPRQS